MLILEEKYLDARKISFQRKELARDITYRIVTNANGISYYRGFDTLRQRLLGRLVIDNRRAIFVLPRESNDI